MSEDFIVDQSVPQQRGTLINLFHNKQRFVLSLAGGQTGSGITRTDDLLAEGMNQDAVLTSLLGYRSVDVALFLAFQGQICVERHAVLLISCDKSVQGQFDS